MAGNAYGEDEVYYCFEIDKNGFEYNKKRGSYERAGYKAKRFKMKLDMDSKRIEMAYDDSRDIYTCTSSYAILNKPELLSCRSNLYYFSFNTNNGRFVFSKGHGYVASGDDSVNISYGKCDKF